MLFRSKDLDLVGKIDGGVPYLLKDKGWAVDNSNILMDRIIGYDGESIGNSSMLSKVEAIPEEEALKLIGAQQ